MQRGLKTSFNDSNGEPIHNRDIVLVNGNHGWIWQYNGETLVAWDLEGPSCEDSQNLEELLKEKYTRVKVVGTMRY